VSDASTPERAEHTTACHEAQADGWVAVEGLWRLIGGARRMG
jgi:hypothetical protein